MDICFDVTNQTVERSDKSKIVNWSDDYLRLSFDFKTDDWSDCTKFILIFDGEDVYRFALTDDKFVVPEELLTGVKLLFSVYGVNNTYRITTPKIMLRLLEAGYSADVKTLDVDEFTHDVVEEVYIAIDGKADLVHTHTESDITDLKEYLLPSDVKNNLSSTDTDKPLSALQGKELKTLIDGITVNKADTADEGYFATYTVQVDGVDVGDRINIPKDFLLKDADILICDEDDVPVECYRVGDYYFDFLVNTVDDDNPKHLYLLCNSLKDVYHGDGSTIVIVDGVISVKSNVFASKVHTHSKSEVTDFAHTHVKSEITDFAHNHDDRYYTESEVDSLIYQLNNKLKLNADKNLIQTDDTIDLRAFVMEDGMPQQGKVVNFYIDEEEEEE